MNDTFLEKRKKEERMYSFKSNLINKLKPLFKELGLNGLYNTSACSLKELYELESDKKTELAILDNFMNKGWLEKYLNGEDCLNQFHGYILDKITRRTPSPRHRSVSNESTSSYTDSPKLLSFKSLKQSYNKKWIVTFGINNYSNWSPLKNAINDSQIVLKRFEKLGFEGYNLSDEQVTQNNIERIMKNDLNKRAKADDLVVLSFHCHGHTARVSKQPRGFIVPMNAKKKVELHELISIQEIISWLSYIRSRHVLLLFDCCFSGFSVVRSESKRSKIMLKQPCRVAINAGTHRQKVLDGGWGNNSVFTGALLTADCLKNKYSTITELYHEIASKVSQIADQTPTMGRLPGDMGGEIYIGL